MQASVVGCVIIFSMAFLIVGNCFSFLIVSLFFWLGREALREMPRALSHTSW
jgi:hypothetical protein